MQQAGFNNKSIYSYDILFHATILIQFGKCGIIYRIRNTSIKLQIVIYYSLSSILDLLCERLVDYITNKFKFKKSCIAQRDQHMHYLHCARTAFEMYLFFNQIIPSFNKLSNQQVGILKVIGIFADKIISGSYLLAIFSPTDITYIIVNVKTTIT